MAETEPRLPKLVETAQGQNVVETNDARFELASFSRRLGGAVADLSLLGFVNLVVRVAIVLPIAINELGNVDAAVRDQGAGSAAFDDAIAMASATAIARTAVAFMVVSVVMNLAYFAWQERRAAGWTVGKRIPRVSVVDATTLGQITTKQAVVRTLAKYLSGLPLFAGYFAMLFDRRNRTWHDRLARTLVVHRPPASADRPTAGA